jgi:hypothetical protein
MSRVVVTEPSPTVASATTPLPQIQNDNTAVTAPSLIYNSWTLVLSPYIINTPWTYNATHLAHEVACYSYQSIYRKTSLASVANVHVGVGLDSSHAPLFDYSCRCNSISACGFLVSRGRDREKHAHIDGWSSSVACDSFRPCDRTISISRTLREVWHPLFLSVARVDVAVSGR